MLLMRVLATMNAVSAAYVALRVIYAVLYIKTTERKMSFLRSATWGTSVLVLIGTYVMAGRRWAAATGGY
jgi:uncharacterized MAPEG superfamily protein